MNDWQSRIKHGVYLVTHRGQNRIGAQSDTTSQRATNNLLAMFILFKT